MIDN